MTLLAFALLLSLSSTVARADDPQTLGRPSSALAAQQLADHAIHGDFASVLHVLKQQEPNLADPAVRTLIADLQRYQQHNVEHTQTKRQAYDEALVSVREAIEAKSIEDALVAAIDAHSLADDPDTLLKHPDILAVVGDAEAKAISAEEKGDWAEAINLYRALDMLFDNQRIYRDAVKRSAKHVRILQLYVPQKLDELYRARALARGDDEPPVIETESWKVSLRDIELPMLRQALAQSAREHINGRGYLPLMQGAVHSLSTLLDTDALAEEFPGFKDHGKLTLFRDYLDRLTAQLNEPNKHLNYFETARIIDRILTTNKETIHLPQQVIVYELTEGATDTLDDFSAVIWPEEKAQFSRNTQGKFYGVGIQISRRDGRLIVVSPLPNTPAQRAGIKAGDIIAQVDGMGTDAWTLERAVRTITGPINTLVSLGIERTGEKNLLDIPIRRAEIVIESILGWQRDEQDTWDYWIDRDAGIGYVRMMQFIPQTADDLDAAVAQMMEQQSLHGLILDLRFNPGGLLSSAIEVVDRFIGEGPIVSTVTADERQTEEWRAQPRVTYPRFPVVILVNRGSASASEIVSGALQDYGRAYVVGERSFGKGSVQDLFPLDRAKAYLKLTTQYYMLPRGRIIHRKPDADTWGIEPDLAVAMTDRQTVDALKHRQEVDVIRDHALAPPPESPKSPEHTPAQEVDPETNEPIKIEDKPKFASQLISEGLDTQLEAALLLLKTQLLADEIALARGE